ncbi:MAG: diguanylate cyclase, partial [Pseudobutyrivibrio sp.]|nr:diguanylate cyclase [Pseudobutyrivibrio sp.]
MPTSFVEQKAMALSQKPGAKSYQEWLDQLNAAYGLDVGIVQG